MWLSCGSLLFLCVNLFVIEAPTLRKALRSALPPACIFFSWIADHESMPTDLFERGEGRRGKGGGMITNREATGMRERASVGEVVEGQKKVEDYRIMKVVVRKQAKRT